MPLVVHVDPQNPVAIHKSCRYCPRCDLLIAHQDELEAQLAALHAQQAPDLAGNRYLVLGTLDREVWRRSLTEPLTIPDLLAQLHDFVQVVEIKRSGIWGAGA